MKESTAVCLMNVAIVAIFAVVAMKFGQWWIVLFSVLALASYKSSDKGRKNGPDDSGK